MLILLFLLIPVQKGNANALAASAIVGSTRGARVIRSAPEISFAAVRGLFFFRARTT
jgi:hypothetical protein